MEEREQEEIQKDWKKCCAKGEEEALKKVPRESGRWAQIPAGPVVPAQGAVLPPHVKLPPTALCRTNPPGSVVPAQRAVLPAHTQNSHQRLEKNTRKTGSTEKWTGSTD